MSELLEKLPWEEFQAWMAARADQQVAEAASEWLGYYVGVGLMSVLLAVVLALGVLGLIRMWAKDSKP